MKSGKTFLWVLFILVLGLHSVKAQVTATDSPPPASGALMTPPPAQAAPAANVNEDKFGAPDATATPPASPDGSNPAADAGAATDDLVYLNATDVDIKDMIKQISKATGTNFLIDDKVRGKVTIISEKPMTRDMAYQAFLSALQVMGYTTVATPAGLIKIVGTKDALTEPIELFKDEMPYTDRFITRIVQVRNISANDLATVIKPLVSKEGNLFAYPATNSMIITDSGSNIDRVLRIAKELDQEGPQEVMEIVPIQNADAADIADKIVQLFDQETKGGAAPAGRRGRAGAPELEDTPSISKVISDQRTNSVIILGSKRAILKVRAVIAQLDAPVTGVEGGIHVYYLKYANAKQMAEVLSNLVSGASGSSKKEEPKTAAGKKAAVEQAGKVGAVELEGGVKVTADESTNSLVITASPKDFETLIDKVVSKLDLPRKQVYLEAVVMELRVDKIRNIGLSGNLGNVFSLGGGEMTGFGSLLPTFSNDISNIAAAAGGLAGGVSSTRTVSFDLGGGKTVTVPAVSALIHALQTDQDANVLSTPSILTLDNEEAQIQVGQEVPTPSGTTVSSGVTTFNVTRQDTGIILKITPQISESNTVRLKLTQEVKNVVGNDPNLGPTLTKRSVQTVVVAQDKQTIVIGGLIDDQASVTTNKVPFLGDVPVVGNLFKNRINHKTKTNIVVFITPYIIRDRADYLGILQKKIEERNLFVDLNYGTSQRKAIRESIRNHAKELLEYRGAVSDYTYPSSGNTRVQERSVGYGSPAASYAAPVVVAPTPEPVEDVARARQGGEEINPDFLPPTRRVKTKSVR